MERVWHYGFYTANETYGDDDGLNKMLAANPEQSKMRGFSPDYIRMQIANPQFQKFERHSKLLGHRACVYKIKNLTWQKKDGGYIPKGNLEEVFKIDFGEEIKNYCMEDMISLQNSTHINKRVKEAREIQNPYFTIFYDNSEFAWNNEFRYSFSIKEGAKSIEESLPLEYKIEKYVLVDKMPVESKIERAQVIYSDKKKEKRKPEGIIYTRKK